MSKRLDRTQNEIEKLRNRKGQILHRFHPFHQFRATVSSLESVAETQIRRECAFRLGREWYLLVQRGTGRIKAQVAPGLDT